MTSANLEEQQEKLRRVVDDWRSRSHDLLKTLHKDSSGTSPALDACSLNSDPVRVHSQPLEHSDILTLIGSDNVAVSKFTTVLSYNCIEISRLTQHVRRNICRQLLLFGHGSSSQEILLEGEPQKAFGHSLSLFIELSETASRMSELMCNLLQQLDSIYSLKDKNDIPCKSFKKVTLTSAFSSFADGLAMFLVLDEILVQNGHIKRYLSLFARMLNKVKVEPDDFDIAFVDLDCLDQVIIHLEKLLDVGFFRRLLLEELVWGDTVHKVRQNRKFLDACSSFIHDGLSEILSRLDTWKESLFDRRTILHYVALFLFVTYVSDEMPEKRLGKVIGEMLKVVPVIYSEGGFRLMLLDLLRNQFPPSLSLWPVLKDAARDSDAVKKNYLVHLDEMHSRDWQTMKDALAYWIASFQSTLHHPVTDPLKVEAYLQLHFKQIIQGILVASRMQMMAISMLDLHTLLEVPIRREKLKSLCHMVVLMKVIKKTFHDKELDIIKSLPHIINLNQSDIEQTLLMAKDELLSEIAKENQVSKRRFLSSLSLGGRDLDTRLTDSLSAILISLQMLRGGGSSSRRLILSIALDLLQSIGHLHVNCSRIKKLLSKLAIISDFQSIVEEVTSCNFLYWRKEMMASWFSMVNVDVNKFSWLQYLLDAFCDGLWLLKLGSVGKFTVRSHEEEIENAVKNEIIIPLCRDIETDLRLHVHSTHLKGSVHVNPRKTGVRNLSWYLRMEPLQLPFKSIDIKLHVESYLTSTFYNHTAMSSKDWKIYSEMRQLAELKYGLTLGDHLTEHHLNYGVDVIEIVRNLEQFATSYSYNITNQVLIEKVSSCQGRKTLRVVSMEHVASSIATHGLGTIYTAINSVLKFLTPKIIDLSKLLQDNSTSVCSVKEIQFWKGDGGERLETNSNPFLRGEEHDLFMGKLFFNDQELSFLDQLRCIINEIGNILGLLRILQAGVSRHLCSISRFIYRANNIKSFKENSQMLAFSDETTTAGRILDAVVEDKYQAKDHVDFSSFTSIISKELRSSENLHFEDLFLIIPALVIDSINYRVNSKENMLKRGREVGNQIIMDDGFVMGTTFILKVAVQEKSFDGLNWITSARKHLEEALCSLEKRMDAEQRKASRGLAGLKLWGPDVSSVHSTETHKVIDKLKKYQKEVELLHYGINIARTLLS